MTDVLADPVNSALDGPQLRFRETSGRIRRYHPDVSVFFGHPRELTDEDYACCPSLWMRMSASLAVMMGGL